MPAVDLEMLNAGWLEAWTSQDPLRVAAYYTEDARYFDQLNPNGLTGRSALREYLLKSFPLLPPMRYEPDTIWVVTGGFCGRWYCTITTDDGEQYLRGFDLALVRDGMISYNEIYTHPIDRIPG